MKLKVSSGPVAIVSGCVSKEIAHKFEIYSILEKTNRATIIGELVTAWVNAKTAQYKDFTDKVDDPTLNKEQRSEIKEIVDDLTTMQITIDSLGANEEDPADGNYEKT